MKTKTSIITALSLAILLASGSAYGARPGQGHGQGYRPAPATATQPNRRHPPAASTRPNVRRSPSYGHGHGHGHGHGYGHGNNYRPERTYGHRNGYGTRSISRGNYWRPGQYIPRSRYWQAPPPRMVYRYEPAPYGYSYVYDNGDLLLVALTTGLIVNVLMGY